MYTCNSRQSSPTPFPTSELFARVTTGEYCDIATTVPMAAVQRQLAERSIGHHVGEAGKTE